jgi:S-adenosylmethionine-diacylglycerol 3-amino-3-carboxypropyl transferase
MLAEWLNGGWFNLVHQSNLVYNTCWEDPRIDRQALTLGPNDTLAVITSAGCNVLDYALDEPRQIHAVDMNPRQNALLELKLAGIRQLEFEQFFAMFGQGRIAHCRDLYQTRLRDELSPAAQAYWDRHISFFSGRGWRRSFYFHGTSGIFARVVNHYIDHVVRVREAVHDCLSATTLDAQRHVYESELREAFWSRPLRWSLGRDVTLSFLGVPRAQREQVERHYTGGIAHFIEECLDAVFGRLPLADNYFWRVYLTGEYLPECCPEYLKPQNFYRLKAGLVDRISVHTSSLLGFLKHAETPPISRFVLLDHMDWLSARHYPVLEQEWQAILDRATPDARVLWRSGGMRTEFVDRAAVRIHGRDRQVGEMLSYHPELAAALHANDRVHTYGSFYIADIVAA